VTARYKEWVDKNDEKQKEAEKKRTTAMSRFAVGDAVAGAVSDLTNSMLHGISADTPPMKRMALVMTNAKGRGLTLPQIFGFFLGRTLDEAMQLEMTQELEEELYRTELTKAQFNEGLQRLDKHLFDISEAELDDLIATFDEDGSGTISLTEFRDWCFRIPSLTWKTARKTYEEEQLALLKSVPLLADLKIGALRRLLSAMTTEFYNPGDHVMKQGDTEDRSLFVVIAGKADATRDEHNAAGEKTGEKVRGRGQNWCRQKWGFNASNSSVTQGRAAFIQQFMRPPLLRTLLPHTSAMQVVGALPTGAFFGESALLNEEPRSANIVAATKLKCAKLDQKMYERILEDIAETVRMHAEARQGQNIVSEMVELYAGMWKPKLKGAFDARLRCVFWLVL
jgi:CRP-like cAMP-binding protein